MPHIDDMKESRFLTKKDCGPQGILRTIKQCYQENLALESEAPQMDWCLSFQEPDTKPMVCKSVNRQLIAGFSGQPNTDYWNGIRIVIYVDPSVMMKGKVVGGIRTRAPRGAAANAGQVGNQLPRAAEPVMESQVSDEDVPF